MVDPLSVLGAAVGVTSLIIQLTDECVKGFKLYQEAVNLPQTHRYLLVRLHIEQQRFLNFALEAGVLNIDGVICSTLQVNRTLLLAILAEIKALFESYAAANGKYEKDVERSHIDWDDHSEPAIDLMSLLCVMANDNTQLGRDTPPSTRAKAAQHVRGLGKSVAKTARNLRSIVVEPKRLVWAAVDKDSFGHMISKVESLTSFLVSLLDSSQLQRLQNSMSTAYLEILQLRNDVGDLTLLVKALAPESESQPILHAGAHGLEDNTLSQAVAEEAKIREKRKAYLRRLAEIKIQLTRTSELNNHTVTVSHFTKFIDAPLPLSELGVAEGNLSTRHLQQRTRTRYQGRNVWIEWTAISTVNSLRLDDEHVQWRISLLTDLLRSVKPDGFRAALCLGYIKAVDVSDETQFGIVFEEPSSHGTESQMTTLQELLERDAKPSLSARMALCAVLARCIQSLHAVNWLHKALRANNVVFFSPSGSPNLSEPIVSGFELSRPSSMGQLTEKPAYEPSKEIYRHPNAQSSQADGNYRKSYDIYSLGVVIIEIALWKRIKDVVGLENLPRTKPSVLRKLQPWLLGKPLMANSGLPPISVGAESCLQQVAAACGDAFRDVVAQCLGMDAVEEPEYLQEQEEAVVLRLQRVIEQDIVKKLEHIADTV